MHQLENRDKRNEQDEIDLSDLFRFVSRGVRSIGDGIRYTFSAIRHHFAIVVLICLMGLGLGYAGFFVTKPYYTSSITLVLSEIRNQFVENQLNRLSVMIEEDNYEAVARDLDISVDAARQIKEMKFLNLDQELIAEDSVLTGSPFEIELSLYNSSLFNSMAPALANYLENNRYFSKQKRIRHREIEGMILKLRDEIQSIDSIKTTVVSPNGPVNGFVYGQPIDPTNLYREGLRMYQQQVDLEAELDQLDNIQIVNSFTPRLRPTGPKLLKYLFIGGGIALIIAVVVALNLEGRKRKELLY